MGFDLIFPILIAFAVTAALGPFAIPELHKLKFGQEVREDGPQSHLKKQGTPTMGGIMFLLAITLTGILYAGRYPKIVPVLLLTLGFGLVGFTDDYLKVAHAVINVNYFLGYFHFFSVNDFAYLLQLELLRRP